MTARALGIKLGAAASALCLHAALALAMVSAPAAVQMEGQAGGVQARLGSSFADVSAGSISAAVPPQAAPIKPIAPPQMQSAVAAQVAALTPVVPIQTLTAEPEPEPDPEPTAEPEPEADSVARDLADHRPVPRPKREAAQAKPAPKLSKLKEKTKAEAKPKPVSEPAPRGSAPATARAGQTDGQAAAKAASTGAKGKSKMAGNAAASNYPGVVMRKIARVKRPRVSVKGRALVRFSITASGGLGAVGISKSSGSGELDRAALQVVHRAAPFPAPPHGAQRSFAVEIKGR